MIVFHSFFFLARELRVVERLLKSIIVGYLCLLWSCIIVRHEDLTCGAKKRLWRQSKAHRHKEKDGFSDPSKAVEKNPEWIAPFYVTRRCNQLPQEGRMSEKTLILPASRRMLHSQGRNAEITRDTRGGNSRAKRIQYRRMLPRRRLLRKSGWRH